MHGLAAKWEAHREPTFAGLLAMYSECADGRLAEAGGWREPPSVEFDWCDWELEPGCCLSCGGRLWVVWGNDGGDGRRSRWCRACSPALEETAMQTAVAVEPSSASFVVFAREALDAEGLATLGYHMSLLSQLPAAAAAR